MIMKIETNFSKIDKYIKDSEGKSAYTVLATVQLMIYDECLKMLKSDTSDVGFVEDVESMVLSIHKENRGFTGMTINTTIDERYFAIGKDQSCGLSNETIEDTLALLNMKVIKSEERNQYIAKPKDEEVIKSPEKPFLEKDLEKLLIKDLSIIEDGLTLIKNQYPVEDGFIDILARDKSDKLCIIELKKVRNDSKIIQQCVYYPTQFNEEVRMITIAPDYSNKIKKSLTSLGYVEMKTYSLKVDDKLIINDFAS